jgi:hypothetical protein
VEGWRHVKVTDRQTAIDYAHTLLDLSDLNFPDVARGAEAGRLEGHSGRVDALCVLPDGRPSSRTMKSY